jgi:hypothetical protein
MKELHYRSKENRVQGINPEYITIDLIKQSHIPGDHEEFLMDDQDQHSDHTPSKKKEKHHHTIIDPDESVEDNGSSSDEKEEAETFDDIDFT